MKTYLSQIAMRSAATGVQEVTKVLPQQAMAPARAEADDIFPANESQDITIQPDVPPSKETASLFPPAEKNTPEVKRFSHSEEQNKNAPVGNPLGDTKNYPQPLSPDYSYLKRFIERMNTPSKETQVKSKEQYLKETFPFKDTSASKEDESLQKIAFLTPPQPPGKEAGSENIFKESSQPEKQLQTIQLLQPVAVPPAEKQVQQLLPAEKNDAALPPVKKDEDKNKIVIGRITVQVVQPVATKTITQPQVRQRTPYVSMKPGSDKINQLSFGLGQI